MSDEQTEQPAPADSRPAATGGGEKVSITDLELPEILALVQQLSEQGVASLVEYGLELIVQSEHAAANGGAGSLTTDMHARRGSLLQQLAAVATRLASASIVAQGKVAEHEEKRAATSSIVGLDGKPLDAEQPLIVPA